MMRSPRFGLTVAAMSLALAFPLASSAQVKIGVTVASTGPAASLGIPADPSKVQHVQVAFDAADQQGVLEFWRAALGYVQVSQSDIVEPNLIGPTFSFAEKQYESPRNRIHVDVSLPHDQAQARVDAILAAGGRLLGDRNAPAWWSLVDAEGNVVDIATWQGRE